MKQLIRDFSKCPRCRAPTEISKAFSGNESEFWRNCTQCNTYINTYIPQPHQAAVHVDPHRFKGNFGGYGTGKTTTSREEVYKHIFLTPKGNTLIGANVSSQYEQTLKRELEADIPEDFVSDYSTQKQHMDLVNGHRIMYRPFDDPEKLRSYNLSMFVIVEASETKEAAFTQLKTRLRNKAATVPLRDEDGNILYRTTRTGVQIPLTKADWREGIVESNPDAGWIRSNILLVSDAINKYGPINDTYAVLKEQKDPAISSHIAATEVNEFLPDNFINELIKNKPMWWVNRYVFGSFLYAEGLVYPSAMRYIVPAFEIPKHWKRVMAYDYGLSDDSVFLYGAIDEINNLLYIYKEIRTNNKNVEELSRMFNDAARDIPVGGWARQPIIDPKSGVKRDYDKKTLIDHFLDYGISFTPGAIPIDARIYRLTTYLECGKLRIMDCCPGLINELRNYKYKAKTLDSEGWDNKPEDKNNHAINPLEWICMALPADPNKLLYGIYDKDGWDVTKQKPDFDEYAVFALEDTVDRTYAPFDSIEDEPLYTYKPF
jgi:phage terminase large subunit